MFRIHGRRRTVLEISPVGCLVLTVAALLVLALILTVWS